MENRKEPITTAMNDNPDEELIHYEHAIDFATSSWDLATGGLKTLTAKRELPLKPERRPTGVVPDILATSRSNMFALVILICFLLMLIGASIVLLVIFQP